MRNEILSYLTSNLTGDIKTSQELPWINQDTPLYLKNMKRVYVDRVNRETEVLYRVLPPGLDIDRTNLVLKAYLAIDAKSQPTILDSVINTIVNGKDISIPDTFAGSCDYETSFEGDVLVYTFTYRFISII